MYFIHRPSTEASAFRTDLTQHTFRSPHHYDSAKEYLTNRRWHVCDMMNTVASKLSDVFTQSLDTHGTPSWTLSW